MNKYQEAFKRIKEVVVFNKNYSDYRYSLDTMQELVDRETPMKPVKGTLCPKCNSFLVINGIVFHRCLNLACEQRIDWKQDTETKKQ